MIACDPIIYLVFHAPFVIAYSVVAGKHGKKHRSALVVVAALLASHVVSLALHFGAGLDVFELHLIILYAVTPVALWYYFVFADRTESIVLSTMEVLSYGYLFEAGLFVATLMGLIGYGLCMFED